MANPLLLQQGLAFYNLCNCQVSSLTENDHIHMSSFEGQNILLLQVWHSWCCQYSTTAIEEQTSLGPQKMQRLSKQRIFSLVNIFYHDHPNRKRIDPEL